MPFFDEDLIFSIEGKRTGNSLSGTGTVWKENMKKKWLLVYEFLHHIDYNELLELVYPNNVDVKYTNH